MTRTATRAPQHTGLAQDVAYVASLAITANVGTQTVPMASAFATPDDEVVEILLTILRHGDEHQHRTEVAVAIDELRLNGALIVGRDTRYHAGDLGGHPVATDVRVQVAVEGAPTWRELSTRPTARFVHEGRQ